MAVDAEPAMLDATRGRVLREGLVDRVDLVQADLNEVAGLPAGAFDLVWAGSVVHHVPDQLAAIRRLVALLRPGGMLALAEGGLALRRLPFDVGVGPPGLEARLEAAGAAWFAELRTGLRGAVADPRGWPALLRDVALSDVSARSFLLDAPAPLDPAGRRYLVSTLEALRRREGLLALLDGDDAATLDRLLDPADPAWVGGRDDTFLLAAITVHVGVLQ